MIGSAGARRADEAVGLDCRLGSTGRRSWLLICAFAIVLAMPAAHVNAADLRGHGGPIMSVAISDDGQRALTGSFDYSMIYWRVTGDEPQIIHRFDEHDGAVNAVAFVPGTDLAVAASDDGVVRLWDLESGELEHRFEGHSHKVVDVAVSGDGAILASAAWDRTVRLWDVRSKTLVAVLEGHRNNVNAVAFSGDGEAVFSGSYDGTIRMWNTSDGALHRIVLDFGWGVNELRVMPANTSLLFGALDGTVATLDIETGKVSDPLVQHEGPVLSLMVNPASSIAASGGGDGQIHVWDFRNWLPLRDHENPYGPIWTMALGGDQQSIYYGSLDDFAIHWQMFPERPYEHVRSNFPRRFQVSEEMSVGERQFARKCSICHTLTPESANRAGPTLYGVFGRRAGSLPGYAYSDALLNSDIVWNEETIEQLFDHGPQEFVPGTKMPLQRMANAEERSALIVFLKEATQGD